MNGKESMSLRQGTALSGKYIVEKGTGMDILGFSYVGRSVSSGKAVTIKEYFPDEWCQRASDGKRVLPLPGEAEKRYVGGCAQFLAEAKRVAELGDIDGVAHVTGYFKENSTAYIVSEYIEGMDIESILRKRGSRLDYRHSKEIIANVLYTLNHIHRRKILHRNISPKSVYVTPKGGIKLSDFGTAKNIVALADTERQPRLNEGYSAIEQYTTTVPHGPYTDVYSTAALFYMMLTGRVPKAAPKRLQSKGDLSRPSEMGVDIPKEAEDALMEALRVHPKYRLHGTREFIGALGVVIEDEPEADLSERKDADKPKGSKKDKNKTKRKKKKPKSKNKRQKKAGGSAVTRMAAIMAVIVLAGALAVGGYMLLKNRSQKNIASGDFAAMESGSAEEIREKILGDYIGETYEDAKAKVEAEGFAVADPVYVYSDEPMDTVLEMGKEEGKDPEEITIIFTVSGEDKYLTIPSFVGESKDLVRDYFNQYGYTVVTYDNPYGEDPQYAEPWNDEFEAKDATIYIVGEYTDGVPMYLVSGQSLSGGTLYEANGDITFTYSLGPGETGEEGTEDTEDNNNEDMDNHEDMEDNEDTDDTY